MSERIPSRFQEIWSALLQVLSTFDTIEDRLDPARIPEFSRSISRPAETLRRLLESPDLISDMKADPAGRVLSRSASQALAACARFPESTSEQAVLKMFQSLRPLIRAQEILYELAGTIYEVSRYFLPISRREDSTLIESFCHSGSPPREGTGILHFEHERGRRGGYSLYVPESYSADRSWPLVVALHGGSGHGADFFWSWIRDARASGLMLAAPTSEGRTWSLHSPVIDARAIHAMITAIRETWNVDSNHILLTGISDGGTYSILTSILHPAPFTHFAPIAAAVHAVLNREGDVAAPASGLRIYQVHGARDWMFPVVSARRASDALARAGAKIVYREIPDLSHNYPRDENERIIQWFLDSTG